MKTLSSLLFIAILPFSQFANAQSGDASEHSGQASKHSALAVSHAAKGTAQVASAVVAVPVTASAMASSTIASVADKSAQVLFDVSDDLTQPLEITEKVITADPAPNKMVSETIVVTKEIQKIKKVAVEN